MNKVLTTTAAIALALTISACDKNPAAPLSDAAKPATANSGNPPSATPGSAVPAKGVASDAAMTAKVKAALLAEDRVSSAKISVETLDGRVSLKGALPDRAMIDRVLAAVQGIPGVRAVDNQLTVGSG